MFFRFLLHLTCHTIGCSSLEVQHYPRELHCCSCCLLKIFVPFTRKSASTFMDQVHHHHHNARKSPGAVLVDVVVDVVPSSLPLNCLNWSIFPSQGFCSWICLWHTIQNRPFPSGELWHFLTLSVADAIKCSRILERDTKDGKSTLVPLFLKREESDFIKELTTASQRHGMNCLTLNHHPVTQLVYLASDLAKNKCPDHLMWMTFKLKCDDND